MKWIKVTDRLPENGQQILVVIKGHVCLSHFFIEDGECFFMYIDMQHVYRDVTHWMKLPELPKENE